MMILSCDAGGTRTRLALHEARGGRDRRALEPVVLEEFASASAPSLEEIVRRFLRRQAPQLRIVAACIGVPGPVVGGAVRATNLPWVVAEKAFAGSLDIPKVRLVNDQVATAAALPFLTSEDRLTLHPGGKDDGRRVLALLAPGTGLGQAYVVLDPDGRCHPFPSEGGHVEFAPMDELDIDLLEYLKARLRTRVSAERVLSGPGLLNIYAYLKERSGYPEPAGLAEEIAAAADAAAVIAAHGLGGGPPICARTLEIFGRLLGSRAGDVVLSYLSTGGLYLGGGIPRKLAAALQSGGCVTAYLAKGRLAPIVALTPLHIVMNEHAALLGAAAIAAGL